MSEYTYAAYDSEGSILRIESGIARYLKCDDPDVRDDTHYVDLSGDVPEIKPKNHLDVGYDLDNLTTVFQGLPAGVEVHAGGAIAVTDEGPFEIEFDIPGTYQIWFRPPPQYLETELEVTVG